NDSGKKMSATRSSIFRRTFYKEEEEDQSFRDLDPFLYDGDDGSTVVTQNTRLGGLIRQMEHNSKKEKLQKQNFRTTNQARTIRNFRTESYHYE
ncbi:serine/threonine-protein kinase KIN82, partial [Biomphalaria glabrata]